MLAPWIIRDRVWDWQRTLIMGVLNVTPDSFSDGGQFFDPADAIAQAKAMLAAGVDVIDIGGESSRPGAEPVAAATECERIVPIIETIRSISDIPISIDTTKASVLTAAIAAGADILNDISAGRHDAAILPTAAALNSPVVLMHMQGEPRTMQHNPSYGNVVDDVMQHLAERCAVAQALGIHQIALDPGIGFGKNLDHNLSLLRELSRFQTLGCPVLVGVSRKRFIGTLLNRPHPSDRVWGTAAACAWAIAQGAQILRVHDVAAIADVATIIDAIRGR